MTVEEFIAVEAAKPFAWGDTDCAMTVCRWIEGRTGMHPLVAYGRRYTDEAGARAWLAERGSIAVGMNRVMRHGGFAKTSSPCAGDVGLIVHDGRICAAIDAGRFWFSRDESGLIGAPPEACWKAWSIV